MSFIKPSCKIPTLYMSSIGNQSAVSELFLNRFVDFENTFMNCRLKESQINILTYR